MKHTMLIAALSVALSGCITAAEADRSQAWAECEKLIDKASRSSCMTKALSDANAERRAEAKQIEQESEAIEDQAAINQAHGVPADEAGSVIVREPFE